MYILDANILIYAFRRDAPQHQPCHTWLTRTLSQGEDVTAPSVVELALLRITTLPSLGEAAATPDAVTRFLTALKQAGYRRLDPGEGHTERLGELCTTLNLRGNDANDAFLAALTLENRATLVSADKGFTRFPGLRHLNPLTENTNA